MIMQPSTKISAILSQLCKTVSKIKGLKTLIFSQWTMSYDISLYHSRVDGHSFCKLDGKIKADLFDEELIRFKNGKFDVCLIPVGSRTLGSNLAAVSQVKFLNQRWNPSVENQAIDTVHRVRQEKSMNVHFFRLRITIGERVKEVIGKKMSIINTIFKTLKTT